jgi:hypothetical protein
MPGLARAVRKRYLALLAGVVMVLLILLISRPSHTGAQANKLAVVFVGMTNNPVRTLGPPRVEVCQRARGLCALFLVTNTAKNDILWFKTAFAEQKTGEGWKALSPGTNRWYGMEGSLWTPGCACLIAVGWPPGLPTNSTWRLRVGYGRNPSGLGILINQKLAQPMLRRDLFRDRKEENVVSSSEVVR